MQRIWGDFLRKVITFGVFDYFHLGHLRLLQRCKEHGDYLIVAVQDENFILKYKPTATIMYSTSERVEMLQALRVVDEIVIYQRICPEFLQTIDFDVLALGEDQTSERFLISADWCKNAGKDVVRLKRTPGISSSFIKKTNEESQS